MTINRRKLWILGLVILFVFSLSLVAAAEPATTPQANAAPAFSDIAGDNNALYINYLAKRGLVSGYPDGSFHPSQGLSRAEAACIMVRAAGIQVNPGVTAFNDVEVDYWASTSIAAAASAGLVAGYSDGNFHPEENITRAQGISMILRLSKQDSQAVLPGLQDIDAAHWAARPVAVALASEMVGLTADKQNFLPDEALSRSDLARALALLLTKDPDIYTVALEGQIKVSSGKVLITKAGAGAAQEISGISPVAPGDLIVTGENGSGEIIFPDGSGMLLKENTELTLKEARGRAYIKLDGSPGVAVDWVKVDLKEGKLFGALATQAETGINEKSTGMYRVEPWNSGALIASLGDGLDLIADEDSLPWWEASTEKRVKIQVDMPWCVAGIRGTFWENKVSPSGQSSTNLLTGSGEVTSSGRTVSLAAQQSSAVTSPSAPPAAATALSATDKQEWTQAKDWAAQRAQEIQSQQAVPELPAPAAVPVVTTPVTPAPVVTTPAVTTTPVATPSIVDTINSAISSVSSGTTSTPAPSGGGGGGGGGGSDNTAPRVITSLEIIDSTHVRLTFSEAVNRAQAETVAAYTLSGGNLTGNPSAASLASDDRVVTLTVSGVSPGQTIVVTVSGISDLKGNALNESHDTATGSMSSTQVVAKTYRECQTAGATWVKATSDGSDYIYIGQAGLDMSILFNSADSTTTTYSLSGAANSTDYTLNGSILQSNTSLTQTQPVVITAAKVGGGSATVNALLGLNTTNTPNSAESMVYTVILPDSVDTNAPQVMPSLEIVDSTHVKLIFNEAVNRSQAETVTNYTLSGATLTGNPAAASLAANNRDVTLTISSVISGETIMVTVSGVSDLAGNLVDAAQASASGTISTTPGNLSGSVRSNGTGISGVEVALIKNGQTVNTTTTDNDGNYALTGVSAGSGYQLVFTKTGYISTSYNDITVPSGDTYNLESINLQPVSQEQSGSFEGNVINALTGEYVSGVSISFRPGVNNTDGTIAATVVTDSSGHYSVTGLAAGSYTGQITGTGFNSGVFTATCVAATNTTGQNATITPTLAAGETRIVLTWGESPSDLDSHLTGPTPDTANTRFHTYYSDQSYSYNGTTYVELDLDDLNSYGPETTTIKQQLTGDYIFSVRNFSGSPALASSQAQVKVYRGSELTATFNVPTATQEGNWWTVFKMNGDTITPVNYISDTFEATQAAEIQTTKYLEADQKVKIK